MKTAEMQALARQKIAEMLRDGEAGKLDAKVHQAILEGLRQRLRPKVQS